LHLNPDDALVVEGDGKQHIVAAHRVEAVSVRVDAGERSPAAGAAVVVHHDLAVEVVECNLRSVDHGLSVPTDEPAGLRVKSEE
jgi:hypothetical protein